MVVTELAATGTNGSVGHANTGLFVNSGAFTWANMFNDSILNNTSGSYFDVQLSGTAIAPNTRYQLTLWAVDTAAANNFTETMTPISGTTGVAGSVVDLNNAAPTSNYDYSTTVIFTSDANGLITWRVQATANNIAGDTHLLPRLNGIELSTAPPIPEPMTLSLLAIGGVATLLRRKR